MAKWEIHKRLSIPDWIWWKVIPGIEINVRWPVGKIIIVDDTDPRWDWTLGSTLQEGFSADPNDHYRPWLEKHVGKQGWDWNWGLYGNNAAENKLRIKFRKKHAPMATLAMLLWA